MSEHTPGPWTCTAFLTPSEDDDPVGVYIVEPAHSVLTERYESLPQDEHGCFDEEFVNRLHADNAANSRLIAAAPDLLAACKKIAAWEPSAGPDEPNGLSIMDAIDICAAAIAKASGNS